MIKRKGSRFYLEVYNPQHDWKLLGIVIVIMVPDEKECFVTHVKQPDKHFFIKALGYPINEELLKMLKNANIEYIVIPENGKTGFRAYIAFVEDYLNGESVSEPMTEHQKMIPLRNLDTIEIDREKLKRYLYG